MKQLVNYMMIALMCIISYGCNDSQYSDTSKTMLESRSNITMSFEDANSMIADIQEKNQIVDVNFDAIPMFDLSMPTEEIVKIRVALYRIYTHTAVENNRFIITANAKELNISDATYNYFKANLHDLSNADIERKLSEGYTIEEIMSYKPKFDNTNDFSNLLHY